MPLLLIALLLLVVVAFGGVILLSFVLRYRAGTARRQGRRWVATLNLWMTGFSALLFLLFAAGTSFWIEHSFRFAIAGAAIGSLLGLCGLAFTRWESNGTACSTRRAGHSRFSHDGDRSAFPLRVLASLSPRRSVLLQPTPGRHRGATFPRRRGRG